MTEENPIVGCIVCGTEGARADMFGVEPELLCARCASGVRKRMHVRVRPLSRTRAPIVTAGVVGLAAVLFLLDTFMYPNPTLAEGVWPAWWQAVYLNLHMGPRIWDGDLWPALGSAFFHGGWIHIIFNVWWIWELGRATENGFGHLTMIGLVVGGAMVASGIEWAVNGPGIGLSGVVYALAFFLWAHHKTSPHAAAIMNRRTINFLGMWFVICIVLTLAGTWNIANWAHGAGGLWGWGVGLAMVHARRRLFVPLAALVTVAILTALPFATFGHQATLKASDAKVKSIGADQRQRLVHWFNTRARLEKD